MRCRYCGGPIMWLSTAGFWLHERTGFRDCAARGHGLTAATDADRRDVTSPLSRRSVPFRFGPRRAAPVGPSLPAVVRRGLSRLAGLSRHHTPDPRMPGPSRSPR